MITSPDNEKLKLVRKLRDRRHREREACSSPRARTSRRPGSRAGVEPRLVLTAAGSGIDGEEVEPRPAGRRLGARLRHPGDRRLAAALGASPRAAVCLYLHGVGDPGNVGAVIRTAHALIEGTVVLGPDCADPFSPKAVRASMGAIFAQPACPGRGRGDRRSRGWRWSPTAATGRMRWTGRRRSASAPSARACRPRCWSIASAG